MVKTMAGTKTIITTHKHALAFKDDDTTHVIAHDDGTSVPCTVTVTETFRTRDGRHLHVLHRVPDVPGHDRLETWSIEATIDEAGQCFAEAITDEPISDKQRALDLVDELYASEPDPINIYGLYRNIVPRHRIPGLKSDPCLDDQTQGWWLVWLGKDGKPYLVDTYHIGSPSIEEDIAKAHDGSRTDAAIAQHVRDLDERKDLSYGIHRANFDYYYGGAIPLTEDVRPYFEMVCDLREVRHCTNPDDYRQDAIVRDVQLWFEHAFDWHSNHHGVALVRKDAEEDNTLKVIAECDRIIRERCQAPHASHFRPSVTPKTETAVAYHELTNEYIDKLRKLEKEFDRFQNEFHEKRKGILGVD